MNILWLHDNINDHKELDTQLEKFEKRIINFTDDQSCMSFLTNSGQQTNDRPATLIVLNRTARHIIKGIFIDPIELTMCVRQIVNESNHVKSISCQLVLLDDHPNEIMQQKLYQLDSSMIIFKQINLCLDYFHSATHSHPLILITVNALGRYIVPEIHSDDFLKTVFIYSFTNDEKIKWTTKYHKIKSVTMSINDLINNIRSECIHNTLLWHLVCLDDRNDQELQNHLYELDPCMSIFDRLDTCQDYFNSAIKINKPLILVSINGMGRLLVPEIHSQDQLKGIYIFIRPDTSNGRKIKWTTKYDKIKCVCTDLDQLVTYIKQDAAVLTDKIIPNHQIIESVTITPRKSVNRRIMQNYILCWLDSNIDETNDDYQYLITKLRQVVNTVKTFTDADDCIDYFTDLTNVKVFLIISGTFAQRIVPLIHGSSQIDSIYLFCGVNKSHYEEWAKEFIKVKGVFTQIELICETLSKDIHQSDQVAISISFVEQTDSFEYEKLDQLDSSFMYTQLLKEILLDITYDETALKQFANYCREQFVGNENELKRIDEFERTYHRYSAIWWYTSDYFLYPILNRALRIFDIEMIMKMGFFICDLHRHIQQLHMEQYSSPWRRSFIVYRGQGMLQRDFDMLVKTKGGLIAFNNFLSTSLNRDVSHCFAESVRGNPDLVGILFRIQIDTSISSMPFAQIKDISRWQEEEEILFSMQTVFRISEIQQMDNSLFQVALTLTADNDQQLQILTKRIRLEFQGTGFQRLGAFMFEIGQYDQASELYETLLDMTHSHEDQLAVSSVHNQLGAIYSQQGEIDNALAHYYKSLEIKNRYLPPNHLSLGSIYSNIGSALRNQNRLSQALSFMERALDIARRNLPPIHPDLASHYNNIGLLLIDLNNFEKALSYCEKGLEIQQKSLPDNHPVLATSYNNIGAIYNECQEYDKALSYYEKSLEIMQRTLPPNHPELAISYNNLGAIFNEIHEYSKALSYYEKSLAILQNALPPNHPKFATLFNNIGNVYNELEEYSKALSYYEKSLAILQNALPPNHPELATSYNNIGTIYNKLQEYSKALCYYEKSLETMQSTLPSDHPKLATLYNNVGTVYNELKDYRKAISNYEKALEIMLKALPFNHSSLALTYHNQALTYYHLHSYETALTYAEKAVDICYRIFPPSHSQLTTFQQTLDTIREKM